jgi:ABC-type nitrate/sulfonate/bicarbonate transport system substrate-binding protein
MADALAQGQVDAVATWSPHLGEARGRFPEPAAVILRTPIYTEVSVLGVRTDVALTKADAVRRLVRALVRAEAFTAAHRDEALRLVIERIGLSGQAALALRQAWPEYHHQARLDNLLLSALEQEAAWLAQRDPAHPPVPDFRAVIDSRPLRAIRPLAVHLAED